MSGTTNFFSRSANTANRPETPAIGDLTSTIDLSALRALAALGSDRESRGTLLGVSAASALLLSDLVEHVRHLGKQQEAIASVAKNLEHVTTSAPLCSTGQDTAPPEVPRSADLRITVVLDQNSVGQFGPVITTALNDVFQNPIEELGQHAAEFVNTLGKAVTQQETLQRSVVEVLGKMDNNSKRIDELYSALTAEKSTQTNLETHISETVRRLDNLSQALDKMGFDVGALVDMTATVEREAVAAEALAGAMVDIVADDLAAKGARAPDRHPRPKKNQ
jgi:hypothetical protein